MERTLKVLLVDDEPFMLRAVTGVLESGGFDVVSCEQWMQVASTVRRETPDLVLLDYNMPTLRGDGICSILKRNGSNPAMKIVLFSSEPPADLAAIADECGADGVIAKNLPAAELLQRVRWLTRDAPVASA